MIILVCCNTVYLANVCNGVVDEYVIGLSNSLLVVLKQLAFSWLLAAVSVVCRTFVVLLEGRKGRDACFTSCCILYLYDDVQTMIVLVKLGVILLFSRVFLSVRQQKKDTFLFDTLFSSIIILSSS